MWTSKRVWTFKGPAKPYHNRKFQIHLKNVHCQPTPIYCNSNKQSLVFMSLWHWKNHFIIILWVVKIIWTSVNWIFYFHFCTPIAKTWKNMVWLIPIIFTNIKEDHVIFTHKHALQCSKRQYESSCVRNRNVQVGTIMLLHTYIFLFSSSFKGLKYKILTIKLILIFLNSFYAVMFMDAKNSQTHASRIGQITNVYILNAELVVKYEDLNHKVF